MILHRIWPHVWTIPKILCGKFRTIRASTSPYIWWLISMDFPKILPYVNWLFHVQIQILWVIGFIPFTVTCKHPPAGEQQRQEAWHTRNEVEAVVDGAPQQHKIPWSNWLRWPAMAKKIGACQHLKNPWKCKKNRFAFLSFSVLWILWPPKISINIWGGQRIQRTEKYLHGLAINGHLGV